MKTYENFITDLFRMTPKKFANFLIKFINSVIVNDKVKHSWTYANANYSSELESHHIDAIYLQEYVIDINEENDEKTVITIEFWKLPKLNLDKAKSIITDLENVQEFIKIKIQPIIKSQVDVIIRLRDTNRVKYVVYVSDLEKVIPSINKENYEAFLDQKKYNL